MVVFWKVILTILIFHTITVDGNRARRRRQVQIPNQNPGPNNIGQPPMGPNAQILNVPGQPSGPMGGQNDIGTGKQGGRQYYYPYQGQTGYGSIQGLNYPYAGAGVGSYQYNTGQYGYGQMGQYGNYYNPNQGSNSFYGGYGGGSYNRPGGYSNYYPSSGSNYFGGGGYYWNAGQKQNINMFTVFLSSLLTLIICLITV